MFTAISNPDIAHTTGNATFIMVEYLRSLFPENFFRYTHIGSRLAYKEFMNEENSLRSSPIKKVRPILAVKPRPIFFNDDIFLSHTPFMYPVFGTQNNPDRGDYIRCFRDNENDITLGYKMNRMRVQCLVSMAFNTEIQQQNIYVQLRNRFEEDRPYWMKGAMEITVPFGTMESISQLSGIPLIDPDSGTSRKFLDYLIAHSNKYFTYKQNHGKHQNDYFLYYPLTIECVFSDFNMEEPNRKGQTNEESVITFTFTTEFNTIGAYQLSTEKDDVDLRANTTMQIDTNGMTIRPMFTVDNLFKSEDKDGYKLFFTNIFEIDPDIPRDKPDILELNSIFKDSSLKEVLEYHKKHGIPYDILFNFIIMKNNKKLNSDRSKGKLDYVIDLENERILIFNKTHDATYRILIYVNNLYIMSLMNSINNLDEIYESKDQSKVVTEGDVKNEIEKAEEISRGD